MILLRKSSERGHAHHGWLDSYHSFSFADYHDPKFMGFRSLRVINEDRIAGGGGFPSHPHRDMEIITYMVEGRLQHQDSMGNLAIIVPGEVQKMTSGTGVIHSEINASEEESAHLLQIWIMTNKKGAQPGYGQKNFQQELNKTPLVLVTSQEGREGSIQINQDVDLYLGRMDAGTNFDFNLHIDRYAWIQLIKGNLLVNKTAMNPGDGMAISRETKLMLEAKAGCEFLAFDLN